MKTKHLAILSAVVLAAVLTACGPAAEDEPGQDGKPGASAQMSRAPESSMPNDAMEGGGAGGTNDTDNDGKPDASPDHSERVSGDGPLEDLGDAAGDLIQGAGDAAEDAGDAVGKAADRAGRAMK